MATTTPNFGWAVPTSTDLVKDGAVAIETLGDSIDASLVDLKGGTTGQVLAKTTNTDMDFTWTTPQVGDITGVTAGTGISGGGTSGTVTVTNDMATTITTSGDLIYGTGAGTYTRRGVGSTGQVLTVSGGVPTWATPASGVTFVGAAVYNNSGTSVATGTWTVMTFPSEFYDTDSIHSTVTNTSRFTIPTGKSGKWLVNFVATFEGNNGNCNVQTAIYKNGASARLNRNGAQINEGERDLGVPAILDLVAGDYLEFFVNQNTGINRTFYITNSQGRAEIAYLGA